jgi:hypothetical protein
MARVIRCTVPKCPAFLLEGITPREKWIMIEHIGPLCTFHGKSFIVGIAAAEARQVAEVES